jgi:hypothetical protein
MFISINRFFDKLEDKVRARLSHRSIVYAFIGGSTHVLFWRGIWHTSDFIMTGNWHLSESRNFWGWMFYEPVSLVWATIILLLTGLFVSGFIGERIIISGLKKEKKSTDKTEEEIIKEDDKVQILNSKIDLLIKEVTDIKNELAKK